MKIVVVNLDHAAARRRRVSAALDELGLAFELFRAVDGRRLAPEQERLIDRDAFARQGWPMRAGALGCWLSHRAILAGMIDNGPEALAVLEDDIAPSPELPAVLDALERASGSFGIVFLHRGREVRRFVPRLALDTGHRLGWLRWSHFGTQGYVITRLSGPAFPGSVSARADGYRPGARRLLAHRPRHLLHTPPGRAPPAGRGRQRLHDPGDAGCRACGSAVPVAAAMVPCPGGRGETRGAQPAGGEGAWAGARPRGVARAGPARGLPPVRQGAAAAETVLGWAPVLQGVRRWRAISTRLPSPWSATG